MTNNQCSTAHSHLTFTTGLQVLCKFEAHYSGSLSLRPLSVGDSWPLWDASLNPRFNTHLLWSPPETHFEVRRRVRGFIVRSRVEPVVYLSIVARTSGEWLGLLRVEDNPARGVPDSLELGLWLHPRAWGSGVSVEAGRLATDIAFLETGAAQVIAATSEANAPARKALAATGLKEFRHFDLESAGGTIMPSVLAGIRRCDWQQLELTSLLPAEGKAAA